MNATIFLISTLFNLYLMVVLLRLWLQLAKADFYNPFSQFVVKATHPIVGPMRRVLPSVGSLDTATLLLAFLVSMVKITTLSFLFAGGFPNVITLTLGSLLDVINEGLSLIFWVLILSAVLSWVSQGRSPIEYVLNQLTDPILRPIRKILPPMGGLDLSVLVAIIGLQFIRILLSDFIGLR
ncbi:YggT family protein [Alteromonas sediminis]|uniref:YggT family protein n=1 Tax=Alteromonas sediminis TaxID=2259342 RepID=A0A3N5ZA42_9ALTE|nr:YggT family protein [Alteromonas sediminis]RPJ67914.1 YggT family protein [Alteromonas sediminis]